LTVIRSFLNEFKALPPQERIAYKLIMFLTRFLSPLGLESILEEIEEEYTR